MTMPDIYDIHQQLVELRAETPNLKVRDLKIRLKGSQDVVDTNGNRTRQLTWEYLNVLYDEATWKPRKTNLTSPEAKVLLDNGPYAEESVYRVTAEQDNRGFWVWTKIRKIEASDAGPEVCNEYSLD